MGRGHRDCRRIFCTRPRRIGPRYFRPTLCINSPCLLLWTVSIRRPLPDAAPRSLRCLLQDDLSSSTGTTGLIHSFILGKTLNGVLYLPRVIVQTNGS